jgi:hypothetical protein
MLGKIITDLCLCRNFTKVICNCKASANSCLHKQSNNIKTTHEKLEYSATSVIKLVAFRLFFDSKLVQKRTKSSSKYREKQHWSSNKTLNRENFSKEKGFIKKVM